MNTHRPPSSGRQGNVYRPRQRRSAERHGILLAIAMTTLATALVPLMFWDPDPFRAVAEGDYGAVVAMVRREPELVHRTNRYGSTLLHRAASGNHPRLIEFLVQSGADPNQRSGGGGAPIHRAIIRGNAEAVAALVKVGADPNLLSHQGGGELPIIMAARRGDADVVKALLDAGVDPDARVVSPFSRPGRIRYSATALQWAAMLGHADVVALLLDRGASVIDPDGILRINTALHHVARWDHSPSRHDEKAAARYEKWRNAMPHIIDLLVQRLGDVNFRNGLDETPLHAAARSGNAVVVAHLVEKYPEVEINARRDGKSTPLELALRNRRIGRQIQANKEHTPDGTYYADMHIARSEEIIRILKAHGGRIEPARMQQLRNIFGDSFATN